MLTPLVYNEAHLRLLLEPMQKKKKMKKEKSIKSLLEDGLTAALLLYAVPFFLTSLPVKQNTIPKF